jgi:hypothetical protein
MSPIAGALALRCVAMIMVAVGGWVGPASSATILWQIDPTPNAPFLPPIGDDPFGESGFFGDPDHWLGGVVPKVTDGILVSLPSQFSIILDQNRTVADMTVGGAGTDVELFLNTFNMNVANTLTISSGGFPAAIMTLSNAGGGPRELRTQTAIIGKGVALPPNVVLPGFGELVIDAGGVFRRAHWLNYGNAVLGELEGSEGTLTLKCGGTARIDGQLSIGLQGRGIVELGTNTSLVCGTGVITENSHVTMTDNAKWTLKGNNVSPALTIGTSNVLGQLASLEMENTAAAGHPIVFAEKGLKIGMNGRVIAGFEGNLLAPLIGLAGVIKTDAINGKKVVNDGVIEFGNVDAQPPMPSSGPDGDPDIQVGPFEQASRLTIRGDYEQSSLGLLTVRIGKNDNGTLGNDQLHVITDAILGGGTAILGGGTLSVAFGDTNGFSPSQLTAADYFVVLYAQEAILSQFTFAPIDLGGGKFLEARYRDHLGPQGGQKVVLRVVDTVPAPSAIGLMGIAGAIGRARRRR